MDMKWILLLVLCIPLVSANSLEFTIELAGSEETAFHESYGFEHKPLIPSVVLVGAEGSGVQARGFQSFLGLDKEFVVVKPFLRSYVEAFFRVQHENGLTFEGSGTVRYWIVSPSGEAYPELIKEYDSLAEVIQVRYEIPLFYESGEWYFNACVDPQGAREECAERSFKVYDLKSPIIIVGLVLMLTAAHFAYKHFKKKDEEDDDEETPDTD